MHDLMIDLETLSTHNDAAILSIGACLFDIETGDIGPTFSRHIELDDSPLRGHISADTVKWWLKQDESARQAITQKGMSLSAALINLLDFCPRTKSTKLWSNGATFDLVIIRNALDRHNYTVPWQYWQERDTRTLVDIAERITGINAAKTTPFDGTKHDALADAINQAHYISRAYNLIRTYTQTTL